MASAKKVSSGRPFNLNTRYSAQKKGKTSKNIHGLKSSNRPTIAKIGIQSKDNKGVVTRTRAINGPGT